MSESEIVLQVLKPVYGMPGAPLHCIKTYLDYLKMALSMIQNMLNPCIPNCKEKSKLERLIGFQFDDKICAGTTEFLA